MLSMLDPPKDHRVIISDISRVGAEQVTEPKAKLKYT